VVDEPIKVGWHDGELYLEAHPTQDQADQLIETGSFAFAGYGDVVDRVAAALGDAAMQIDWQLVRRVAEERRGLPARVSESPAS